MTTDATTPEGRPALRWLDALVVALLAGVSLAALEPEQLSYITSTWSNMLPILPTTAWAACKVWLFWGVTAWLATAVVRIIDPTLDRADALLAGLILPWIVAWIAANVIGPLGLFRVWVIWPALGLLALWVRRARPAVTIERAPWPRGAKLAFAAFLLQAPAALVLQLGSPVPPFMDIFATASSRRELVPESSHGHDDRRGVRIRLHFEPQESFQIGLLRRGGVRPSRLKHFPLTLHIKRSLIVSLLC